MGETAAGALFDDPAAGIRFPLPFAMAQRKEQAQLEELLRSHPEVHAPAAAELSSAAYAATGVPFLVVWRLKVVDPVSLADLARLAAATDPRGDGDDLRWDLDLNRGRALGGRRVSTGRSARGEGEGGGDGGEFQVRYLLQLVRNGAIWIAYYYKDGRDGASFDRVGDQLQLTTARLPLLTTPPLQGWVQPLAAVGAALVTLLAYGAVIWLRRR